MMFAQKISLFSILLILLYFPVTYGQSSQLLFESANQDYQQGNYEQAIETYLRILEKGVESSEVQFNLGNAYYKINQYGKAILHYEKAKKTLANDEALEKNLKLVQLRIIDKIEPIPQLFLKEWWIEVLNLMSLEWYAWVTLALFVVLTSLIVINILSVRRINKLIWIFLSIFIFVLVLFINKAYISETTRFGIILVDKISIVSEPSISGNEMFILHEGTKVQVLRNSADWLEIKIADGKTGWLKTESLGHI